MKNIIKLSSLFLILICMINTSCSKDESTALIAGSWYGTHSYYNPVGGIKYQYLTIIFEANGTGSLEYESPVSFAFAKFTYSIKDNLVFCQGAYADSYGDGAEEFNLTLRIEGDRLIPQDRYNMFILTQDGSIETDGNGNIVEDNGNMIYGVWIHNSNEVILVLEPSKFTEYTLLSPSSNVYSKKTEGPFSYEYRQKYVLINNSKFDVLLLTTSQLILKNLTSGKVLDYNKGSASDIPDSEKKELIGSIRGHDWVDLGLSSQIKWATCNVGASAPEGYGGYFAFGETLTKEEYQIDNCFTYGKTLTQLKNEGVLNSLGNLTSPYDVAAMKWGGGWRMPTQEEMFELVEECTWKSTTEKGVKGCQAIGPNGNTIFFPAAGTLGGSSHFYEGKTGYYRSSTLNQSSTLKYDGNLCLFISEDNNTGKWTIGLIYLNVYNGRPIRPVIE